MRIDWRGGLILSLAVGLAFAARLGLKPFIGAASPFLLFTPAVMIASFFVGPTAGAAATIASAILGSHFFLQTLGEPAIERWDRVALFLLVGASITIMSEIVRSTRQRLRDSLARERKARAEAEAANKIKDDFLAVVSHELRTPASVILGWASAIRTRSLTGDSLNRAVEAIERNARVQSKLVEDVLETSRVASGTLRLEPQRADLTALVSAAVEQLRPTIEACGLHLDIELPGEPAIVFVDPIRIQQVLANLLSNASKFTPQGGRITVLMTTTDTRAIVAVADTGVGITPEFLPRVFRRFEQDAATIGHSRRGLGLGLSIAHHLVEQHGGVLEAASEGRGRGATFTMTLPLAPVSPLRLSTFGEPVARAPHERPPVVH